MNKTKLTINIIFLASLGLISFSVIENRNSCSENLKSAGGPPYNTNAPGEKTCSGPEGTNDCHSGGIPDNTGPATCSISSSGGTQYVPGQTYAITPTITHATYMRFGFQLVVLSGVNDANMGDIQITDTTTTRSTFPAYGNFQTREYAMHKLAGTYFVSTTGLWSFNWQAPSTNLGNVIMYACFNAVNNNNINDPGDETYYTTLTLTPSAAGVNKADGFSALTVFPNPARDFFNLEINTKESGKVSVYLVALDGKRIQHCFEKNILHGNTTEKIQLNEKIEAGVYFLKISSGENVSYRKLIVRGKQ